MFPVDLPVLADSVIIQFYPIMCFYRIFNWLLSYNWRNSTNSLNVTRVPFPEVICVKFQILFSLQCLMDYIIHMLLEILGQRPSVDSLKPLILQYYAHNIILIIFTDRCSFRAWLNLNLTFHLRLQPVVITNLLFLEGGLFQTCVICRNSSEVCETSFGEEVSIKCNTLLINNTFSLPSKNLRVYSNVQLIEY